MKKKVIVVLVCWIGITVEAVKSSHKILPTISYHMDVSSDVKTKKDDLEQVVERQRGSKDASFVGPQPSKNSAPEKQPVESAPRAVASVATKKPSAEGVKKKEAQDPAQNAPRSAYVKSSIIPEFDEKEYTERRKKQVVELVDKGAAFLTNNPTNKAFNAFSYNKDFVMGDVYLFVFDVDGVCLAHGKETELLWQNMRDYKDIYGNYIVRVIIEKARQGGGWITYQWRNATKVTYVQEVIKDGKSYIVGSGYYPHSKRDATVSLVRSAAEAFKELIRAGGSAEEVFGKFSYPLGNFVLGDLYLFSLDFKGNIMAQGERPGLIGQNSIDYKDADGKMVNREIIEKLKSTTGGVWIEYKSKRARKISYAEKVTDEKGKDYFIACGYYPEADRKEAIDLVRQGFQYMETHGKSQTTEEINSKTSNAFRYGDLYLMAYDMKGLCIAHGGNPDFIGANQYGMQDEDGKYIVREMIEKAKNGGGWIDFMLKNVFWFVYVELVSLGKDEYIIASGLYPISKPETMQLLIKGAVSLIDDNSREKAMEEIVRKNGRFIRGDLSIFVFDANGICYAYGDSPSYIWRQMINAKDGDNKDFVQQFIATARQGAGKVTYQENGFAKFAYVEPIEKDGTMYIVGSSFYK